MKSTITALALLSLTGCVSQSKIEVQNNPLSAMNEAIKRNPRGPVELRVDYCNDQRGIPPRTLIVAMGEAAVFSPMQATNYTLKAKAFKTADGTMILSIGVQWSDRDVPDASGSSRPSYTEAIYSRTLATKDGDTSPSITFNVNGHDSCFKLTAFSRQSVSVKGPATPGTN